MLSRALAFLCLVPVSLAAEAAFVVRVGAAHEEITPEPSVRNWVTGKPYATVRDPLFVHALVLDDGRTRAALVRWDLVDVSESARDEVRKAIGAALGIPGSAIMVHASHNHSGPWAPVYSGGHRGRERDTWWAIRYMPAQNGHPPYRRWMERLLAATTRAAQRAAESARPASIYIARITAAEYMNNRRPRLPAWGLAEKPPTVVNFRHPDYNPEVLQGGATFGPLDRTLTLVSFRDESNQAIASLFHAAIHAVSIYPYTTAISADWPGAASNALAAAVGGEALFLQGCAGDINPWRRGPDAVEEMAAGLVKKVQAAAQTSVKLAAAPIQTGRVEVNLPLTPAAKERLGADVVAAEIQIIVCGPLALVALPGEPMTELGMLIRDRSPFPQTLVLGYSNGNGAHYVGMPHEKKRGGYEAGVAGAGTAEAGPIMIDAATRLLRDVFEKSGYAEAVNPAPQGR